MQLRALLNALIILAEPEENRFEASFLLPVLTPNY
jgi:hypothetical protein